MPRSSKVPETVENSFEDVHFYSEAAHTVGSLISSSAACFVPLWELLASPLVRCVHLRGSLIGQVSEVAFTSVLMLIFPLLLSLPDCFLKCCCGLFSQPGAGQPLQTCRSILSLAIYCVLEIFLGSESGTAEPLLDHISFVLFVSACVTDFSRVW